MHAVEQATAAVPSAPVYTPAATSPGRPRLTPNLFGISFGLCAPAQCWTLAGTWNYAPPAVADAWWLAVAVVWTTTLVAYERHVVTTGRWRSELTDPVFAPFTVLVTVVPMLLGVALERHAYVPGAVLFAIGFAGTLLNGAWLSAEWILEDVSLDRWHPGYFLPTVAGGYLAAISCAALGYGGLARLMFGYATVCWLVLGSILLLRLFTRPPLPTPLLPTLAIEVAPPVVGNIAWFAVDGIHPSLVATTLAGYAVLMGLVQVRLFRLYRRVPFGLGWWAFAFSYAAVVTDALLWLHAEHVPGARQWSVVLLVAVSSALVALIVRSAIALARGAFLPRPSPAVAAAGPDSR